MDEQSQEHTPICVEAEKKRALLEGYRYGTQHGFEEAIALVRDLSPMTSVTEVLRVLVDHREMWAAVTGASVEFLVVAGTEETAKLGQTPPGGSAAPPPAR